MRGVDTGNDGRAVQVMVGNGNGNGNGNGRRWSGNGAVRARHGGAILLAAVLLLGSATPGWSVATDDDDAGAGEGAASDGDHEVGVGDGDPGAERPMDVLVAEDGTGGQDDASQLSSPDDVLAGEDEAAPVGGSSPGTVTAADDQERAEQPQGPVDDEPAPARVPSDGEGEERPDDPDPRPESTGTATLLRTGNALAVGNLGENEVLQVIEVLVVDGGTVRIEQIAIIVSVGSARAHTGGNVVAAGGDDDRVTASVITGNAVAIGNASFTDIDQRLALEGGPGQTITAEQFALIEHTGVAYAASGANQAIAGSAGTSVTGSSVTSTGYAYAIGNLSEVSIHQGGVAAASGDAWVSSEQHATVVNRGVAVADTGGNLASTPSGGGSLETGVAIAEGSVSVNDVEQRATAVAAGGATVEMRQGALVLNLGVAMARTGGNHLGAASATEGEAAGTGHDPMAFAGFEEALLSIVLADSTDLAGLGSLLQRLLSAALEEPIELWSHWSDATTTSWEDEEHATFVELIQRALVFDLGRAWVESGANLVAEAAHDLATSDAVRDRALAEIRTGDALAIGNLSIVEVCQRMGLNTDPPSPPCRPQPLMPSPNPAPGVVPAAQVEPPDAVGGSGTTVPAPPPGEVAPAEPTPDSEVLEAGPPRTDPPPVGAEQGVQGEVVRVGLGGPAQAPALPRTGTSSTSLVVVGLLLAFLGAAVLSRWPRRDLR